MQEQIQILTSKATKLEHRDSNKEQQSTSKNHQETEPESIPPPPPTTSPRKCSILLRNDIMFQSQNSKGFAGRLCKQQSRDEIRIKRSNTSNSKYNASINRIRKTLPETTRYDSNNVINLSTKSFTFYEFKRSNKNLNFCPKKQF